MKPILIDTREKQPLPVLGEYKRATIAHGDYSLDGMRRIVAVEWKSSWDWARCNASQTGRARLDRQLRALIDNVEFPMLLIEEPPPVAQLVERFPNVDRWNLYLRAFIWAEEVPTFIVPSVQAAVRVLMAWLRADRCYNCRDWLLRCTCEVHRPIP